MFKRKSDFVPLLKEKTSTIFIRQEINIPEHAQHVNHVHEISYIHGKLDLSLAYCHGSGYKVK